MKKNKKLTFILLIAVIGLWVLVFYRLYQSFFSEQKLAELNAKPPMVKVKMEEDAKFILKANYSDPFFGKQFSQIVNPLGNGTIKKTSKPKVEKQPEIVIDWSFISYLGLIKNQKNQKQVALVSISGTEHMVSEGEKLNEVTFLKNHKDSIQVSYKGKTTYLRKK